ncbi:hypothetical protein [Shigella phage SfPhi01]|nr:hypothetical protein [Shigella phage SfPhi01]
MVNNLRNPSGFLFSFYRFTYQNEYGIIELSYRGEHYVKSLD